MEANQPIRNELSEKGLRYTVEGSIVNVEDVIVVSGMSQMLSICLYADFETFGCNLQWRSCF